MILLHPGPESHRKSFSMWEPTDPKFLTHFNFETVINMHTQLRRINKKFIGKSFGYLFSILSALSLLSSCDSGSSSAGEPTPSVVPPDKHLEVVTLYSVSAAEALTQLAIVSALVSLESQRESPSQFLPLCSQGSAELSLPIATAGPGDEITVNFLDCEATVLNDVVTGTMSVTVTRLDEASVFIGAKTKADLSFRNASMRATADYLINYEVDQDGETLTVRSAESGAKFLSEGISEHLSAFQVTKRTDNTTRQFTVDFNTTFNSQLLGDKIDCQTQIPVSGDITYYLSEYDYIATSGTITCNSEILGPIDIFASRTGVTGHIRGKDPAFFSEWYQVIEGPIFHPGLYAMSANYEAAIRIPYESALNESSRVEIKQMQDVKYYFDANDNTAILIQSEVYDEAGSAASINYISLIDPNSLKLLARLEEPEHIFWAFVDSDQLFVGVGTRVDVYKIDRLVGLSLQVSHSLGDHPELDIGYSSWVALPNLNAIFVLASAENAHQVYRLAYNDAGHIFGPSLFHEIPRENEQVRIFGTESELYLASSYGVLTRFTLDDHAAIVGRQEYQFPYDRWDLTDFAVIHSGRVLSILNTAHLHRGKLSSYMLDNDGTLEKVQEIDLNMNDWVVSFSLTQDGEGLIQWQDGDGSSITGAYIRFGIDSDGAIQVSPAANCAPTEGFTSYRYGNQSAANNAFVAGRSSLVFFPYDRTLPQCVAKGLDDHGRLIEGMNGHVTSEIHRTIYVFRNDRSDIAVLKQHENRFEEIGLVSMAPLSSEIKMLLISPDGNNLYVLAEKSIEIFDIDSEGMLHPTVHAIPLSEGVSNSASAVISNSGDRLYVHQSKTARSGSALAFSTDVAIYVRNPLNGELSSNGLISFDENSTADYEIAQGGPIAISPDDRHLYVVTRYFGKLRVIDLTARITPSIALTYLDPIVHPFATKDKHSVRGLSLASGFGFHQDGEFMVLAMDAGSSHTHTGRSEVVLASFGRESESGALELRNAVLRSIGITYDLPGRALGYQAPQLIGDKVFTIRTFGGEIRLKPYSVDVYKLDEHGFLLKRETLSSHFFGKGVEQISTWESTRKLIGINPQREKITTFSLTEP